MKPRLTCVDDFLNRAFYQIGITVGRHPGYFIIVPLLVGCICITGFQRIHYEIDPEYLFSPVDGPGKYERAVVEQYFKVNYSHQFSIGRITRPGRFGHVIVIPKDGNDNMLRNVIWKELILLDEIIKNATAEYEGETFTYESICARWLDQCFTNDILNLHHVIESVETRELNLTFPIMFNPVTWDTHLFPVFFGGSVISEDFTIETVPSVQLAYFVRVDSKRQDAIGSAWEEAFLNAVGKADDSGYFKHISVARFASRTLELELEANTRTVVPYFTSTFVLMGIFSIVTCMMTDWVRSKPWLGLLGNVSAAIATVAAFGLCMYMGVDFIGLNLAAPFLMIGIGIDDTFVVLAAWRRTSITLPVPERMGMTLSEAAISISITSFTDMISLFLGVISPFPSVQIFCIYSGVAVVFTFLFHLTFFSGCLAISGYCERANRHSVVCVKVQPLSKSKHRSWLYRTFCSGGVDPNDPDNPIDNPEHGCMAWFRDSLGTALSYRSVKAIIITIFFIYMGIALYGLTTIEEGLDRRKLSKDDSYSITFYDREDEYFREFPYRIQVVVSGQYDYSNRTIQSQMENLTKTLENTKWITAPIYTESWIRSFLSYINRNEELLDRKLDNEKDFNYELKRLWLHPNSTFALDVKFDDKNEHVIASRFLIQAVNVSGTNQEKDMVKELRQICVDSPLNVSVFHPYFVFFDQFELVKPTSVSCMFYGALIMMLISFIFIPDILCCMWVAICIISIEIGVGGYMSLWGVNLDSISMINLIMCIGFSVDFTAHICYAYMSSKKRRPEDRVRECLYSLGLPIVQGALSTILGLVALLLAGTYIFMVFFKMVFLVIFIGALHGLFLLPVLLSMFGPNSCTNFDHEEDDDDDDDDGKSKTHISTVDKKINFRNGGEAFVDFDDKIRTPYIIPQVYYHKKLQEDDRDPGLGTSEDSNSTESGSSQSRRRQQELEESKNRESQQVWRRSISGFLYTDSQFQPYLTQPAPDYPGAEHPQRAFRTISHPNDRSSLKNNVKNQPQKDHRRTRSQNNLSNSRYSVEPRF